MGVPGVKLNTDFIRPNLFARLEANGLSGRNSNFLASPRVSSHTTLAWFDNKDSETSEFDSFSALEGILERVEHGFNRDLGFYLRDVELLSDTIHNVLFYHADPP